MITIRKAGERGHFNHGWLNTYHTFSFADYQDARHMGFRSLRVINEDRVQPGVGFGEHGHRDMEILTYVLEGALEHRDSIGTHGLIRPGDMQRMSAGTGIRHSEYNSSQQDLVHFYQIWILPSKAGVKPEYEQKHFPETEKHNRFRIVASPDGRDGSLRLHQDALVHAAVLEAGAEVTFQLPQGRHAWLQVLRGETTLKATKGSEKGESAPRDETGSTGTKLSAGDGASCNEAGILTLGGAKSTEVLLFDLA